MRPLQVILIVVFVLREETSEINQVDMQVRILSEAHLRENAKSNTIEHTTYLTSVTVIYFSLASVACLGPDY